MPPRKKAAPAKHHDDFIDDDDADEVDEEYIDDEPVKKKRKAPAKEKKPKEVVNMDPHTATEGPPWELRPPNLLYRTAEPISSEKIAAFDFDGTLVQFKDANRSFALAADDWTLFNAEVPKVLKQYFEDGYKIVIFSNQSNIGGKLDGPMSIKLRTRAENALEKIAVPATIMYATGKDKKDQKDAFRKPATGMWDYFVELLNGGVTPDKAQSFYVGDMAGRPGNVGSNPDSDKVFAEKIGLPFKTPEEVFGQRDTTGAAAAGSTTRKGPNADLAAAFDQLADVCLKKGDNPFKVRAFQKSAGIIAEHPVKITCGKDMKDVKGIGKGSQEKIDEFIKTGTIGELEEAGGVRKADAPPTGDAAMAMKFL